MEYSDVFISESGDDKDREISKLQAENDKLKEISALALDIHTRDPMTVKNKWGFNGVKVEELLVSKIEALKGESDG